MVGKCVALLMLYSYSRILGILGTLKERELRSIKAGEIRETEKHARERSTGSEHKTAIRESNCISRICTLLLSHRAKQAVHYNYDSRTV